MASKLEPQGDRRVQIPYCYGTRAHKDMGLVGPHSLIVQYLDLLRKIADAAQLPHAEHLYNAPGDHSDIGLWKLRSTALTLMRTHQVKGLHLRIQTGSHSPRSRCAKS